MANEEKVTPDLSKIVSMIMERPDLISEIANLGKKADEGEKEEVREDIITDAKPKEEVKTAPTLAKPADKRAHLLNALKPYLSDKRAAAVDSILTFSEVFDLMRGSK